MDRYKMIVSGGFPEKDDNGPWVKYSDVEPLQQQLVEIKLSADAEQYNLSEQLSDRDKLFPMQDGPDIPFYLAEHIYQAYSAVYGTSQSLKRIGERGGFAWSEIPIFREAYRKSYKRYPDKF